MKDHQAICDKKKCSMNKKGFPHNCCFFEDISLCENSPIYDKEKAKLNISNTRFD